MTIYYVLLMDWSASKDVCPMDGVLERLIAALLQRVHATI
jgi:hypothetical protein